MDLAARVRAAHADAWQVQGRLREPHGGGAQDLRGIRVMASGLPHAQFNSGDVTDPDPDVEGARAFYAARGVPWGVRVPAAIPWDRGCRLARLRLMGTEAAAFHPAPAIEGLRLRAAVPHDLDAVLAIDTVAFGADPALQGAWLSPHLGAADVTVALGELAGEPVATGYAVHSDGRAGPAVSVAGVGVLPAARGRGIAGALTSWLVSAGWARGARLAHLQADSHAGAAVYTRLGFVEAGGLDVYVDL